MEIQQGIKKAINIMLMAFDFISFLKESLGY